MPCFSPLKAFDTFDKSKNGKPVYKIVPYKVNHIEFHNGSWSSYESDFVSPFASKVSREFLVVPCGKCLGCRLAYSREWANRCMLELGYHKQSWFVTLTYNDKHLPVNIRDDGVPVASLNKYDLQCFFKRLRVNYERMYPDYAKEKLRYYVCGEYGPKGQRPHYHAIIFGLELPPDDLFGYVDRQGYKLCRSKLVEKSWNMGFCTLGPVTWDSCAYTARYMLKKQKGKGSDDLYFNAGLVPEFVLMSRRPGIAALYYQDHKEHIYKYDAIYIATEKSGRKIKPPKYFDRLFDIDNPVEFEIIKESRLSNMQDYIKSVELETHKTYDEYLKLVELEFKEKGKKYMLRRYENGT